MNVSLNVSLSFFVPFVLCANAAGCAPPPKPAPNDESATHAKGRCPPGMALIAHRFCVDRWEASLVETGSAGERPFSPYATPQGRSVRAVSLAGVVPQGYISREQAESACRSSGKRLCAEDEWETACRGVPPRVFPYGDTREKGACNDTGISPLGVYFSDASEMYNAGPMNDSRLNQTPHTLAKTGAFERCTNAFGVFDMVGNLHEWVMSARPTFRGGYYQDVHINGDGCGYRTTAHAAGYHDYSTGFRCCADPAM